MRWTKTIAVAAALLYLPISGYCTEKRPAGKQRDASAQKERASSEDGALNTEPERKGRTPRPGKTKKGGRGWAKKIVIFPFEEDQELITGEKAVFLVELVDKEIKNALGRSFQVIKVFMYSEDAGKEAKPPTVCDRDCRLSKAKESGIDYAVLNETTKFWDSWAITLELFDLDKGRTVKSVSAGCDGSPKELINVVNDLASDLARSLQPEREGPPEALAGDPPPAEAKREVETEDYTAMRAGAHGLFWSGLVLAGVGLPMGLTSDEPESKAGWLILASGGAAMAVGGAAIGLVLLNEKMKTEKERQKKKKKRGWLAAVPVGRASGFILSAGQRF